MRIVALLRKELIQMRRDPMTIGVTFLLPLVYLIVFGMAISTDVKHQSTVVFDQSRSEESRSFLAAMTASGYFDLRYIAYSYEELDERIQNGDARIGIVFPPDLTAEANRGRTVPIQAIVDASDSIGSTSAYTSGPLPRAAHRRSRPRTMCASVRGTTRMPSPPTTCCPRLWASSSVSRWCS